MQLCHLPLTPVCTPCQLWPPPAHQLPRQVHTCSRAPKHGVDAAHQLVAKPQTPQIPCSLLRCAPLSYVGTMHALVVVWCPTYAHCWDDRGNHHGNLQRRCIEVVSCSAAVLAGQRSLQRCTTTSCDLCCFQARSMRKALVCMLPMVQPRQSTVAATCHAQQPVQASLIVFR